MRRGDLVIWHTPESTSRLGLVVEELLGHGPASTGWWRIFAGGRKHLVRASHCVVLRSV